MNTPRARFSPHSDTWAAWMEQLGSTGAQSVNQSTPTEQARLFHRFSEHYGAVRKQPRAWRRRAQRALKTSLGGVAMALALSPSGVGAAVIEVGPTCALTDAIVAANSDAVQGGCLAGDGTDTVVLPAGSLITLTTGGLPGVTSEITIEGNGSTIRRSHAANTPEFRIVEVGIDGALSLRETTISGGNSGLGAGIRNTGVLAVIDSAVSGNTATYGGAAIFHTGESLLIQGSTIDDNQGVEAVYLSCNRTAAAENPCDIVDSVIADNSGDGLFIQATGLGGGDVTVNNSVLTGNGGTGVNVHSRYYCPYDPCNFNARATITDSTISGNGTGVRTDYYASLSISDSTVAGNAGVGIDVGIGDGRGVNITNTTVSGNAGTGVVLDGGDGVLSIQDSTITGNARGVQNDDVYAYAELIVERSIVSGNLGADVLAATDSYGGYDYLARVASAYSVFGDSAKSAADAFTAFVPDSTDITATSDGTHPTPLVGILATTLADNGGPTQTHALVGESPALDALPTAAGCATFDQRGVGRPVDGDFDGTALCDIGAVEFNQLEVASVSVPVRAGRQQNLIDGDPTTSWGNDGDLSTAWFEVNLATPTQLNQLLLWPRTNRAYEFRVFVDGMEVALFNLNPATEVAPQTLELPAGTEGSVVRLESTRSKFIKIHEFALTGVTVSAPLSIVDAEVLVRDDLSDRLFDGDTTTFWKNDGDPSTAEFELVLSASAELTAFRLAPRTNRDYRFEVYVEDVLVGQYTTAKADDIALQTFALPPGTQGSRVRFVLLNRQSFKVYEVEMVGVVK